MGYKFLELPNFDKKEQDLDTDLDKWFYLLKNLSRLDKIPSFLDKRVFQKIFKIAEMSKMTKEERELYHSDVKAKSDWNAGIRFAEKKAKAEGLEEGLKEGLNMGMKKGLKEGELNKAISIATLLKQHGMPFDNISEITGLSSQEIEFL